MKTELTSQTLADFQKRFGSLHDGLIEEVTYLPGLYQRQEEYLSIRVQVYDWQHKKGVPGTTLLLEFEEIEAIILRRVPNFSFPVIFAAGIAFQNGNIHFNFFGEGYEENIEIKEIKKYGHSFLDYAIKLGTLGPFLFVAAIKCSWSEYVKP